MVNGSNLGLKELIISVGFLTGIWLAVGVNPEAEILKVFTTILVELGTGFIYILILKIMPIIAFIGTLIVIYSLGGGIGLIAVGLGFIGGLLIISYPIMGVIFLLLGLGLGSIAEK